MNQSIYNYLKKYNKEVLSINRLLVSSFINIKQIKVKNNLLLKKLLIKQEDEDEYIKLQEFINLIKKVDKKFCFEELLELFEFVISPSDKLVNGAIYTPKDIREYITKEAFKQYQNKDINNYKIVDISCGCGGFLIDATKLLKKYTNKSHKQIYKDNIFGVDIQKYSIERTEILLSLLSVESGEDEEKFTFNLLEKDSLEYEWKKENDTIKKNGGFDIVLGNPPYVCSRNMDDKTKSLMSTWTTCSTGHPDLYIPFFEIGFELLKPQGILGYITVNSFIKSLNGRAIRKYFQDKQVDLRILDFEDEQIFASRMTYTSICFLINDISKGLQYTTLTREFIKKSKKPKYSQHSYKKLSVEKGWYLKNRKLVKQIEKTGIPFGNIYNTKSGIATLKNNIYIFKPIDDLDKYYLIDKETKIEKEICKNIVNSNLFVKANSIDNIEEKIIFPYFYDDKGQCRVMDEDIMEKRYPCAYNYLFTNKELLDTRDKGKGKFYKNWYAFGRNQSLERKQYTLLFPQLARKGFQSYISDDQDLYFYNGMGVLSDDLEELQILQKVFLTDIFWTYVSSISKHYASNYFSLGRNYIKHFGIYEFSESEKQYIINENNIEKLNNFFKEKYNL